MSIKRKKKRRNGYHSWEAYTCFSLIVSIFLSSVSNLFTKSSAFNIFSRSCYFSHTSTHCQETTMEIKKIDWTCESKKTNIKSLASFTFCMNDEDEDVIKRAFWDIFLCYLLIYLFFKAGYFLDCNNMIVLFLFVKINTIEHQVLIFPFIILQIYFQLSNLHLIFLSFYPPKYYLKFYL